jgi:flagellin-specific chaperone FliS
MSNDATNAPFAWRDHLAVHPAADEFPLLSESELKELAEDIRKNGLQQPIILSGELLFHEVNKRTGDYLSYLVDGRNRLDALALLGWLKPARSRKNRESLKSCDIFVKVEPFEINLKARPSTLTIGDKWHPLERHHFDQPDEVYSFVLSLNVHRRHLTAEKKRDLIAKLLKANPEQSNRTIAKQVKADHHKVAKVRHQLESTGEVAPVEKTVGADGKARKQPSKKPERNPVEATKDDSAEQYMAFEEALQAIEEANEELDVPENPANYVAAFALRAEEADRLSRELEYLGKHMMAEAKHFKQKMKPDEIIKVVRTIAEAWSTVADKLEQARASNRLSEAA